MNDILFEILKTVVIIAVILVTRYFIPALKSYVSRTNYAWIVAIVKDAVECAEQTIKEEKSGPKKKALVMETVGRIFSDANINITQDQLNALVESAVYTMNKIRE